MSKLVSLRKTLAVAAVGAAGLVATASAHAGGNVFWSVGVNLPPGVTLLNADGLIAGSPYLVISRKALAPGVPVSVRVRFGNAGPYAISYTPKVVTGSF